MGSWRSSALISQQEGILSRDVDVFIFAKFTSGCQEEASVTNRYLSPVSVNFAVNPDIARLTTNES